MRKRALQQLRQLACTVALLFVGSGMSYAANTCSPAASGGLAASDWRSYCWLDFTGYNATTAASAFGQNFSFALSDGSTLSLNVKATNNKVDSVSAPSWSGAAIGNSAYLGIPGEPILYTTASGTVTLTLSNITVTPPSGVTASTGWAIVAADAESTNGGESLSFTTNKGAWALMQSVPAPSGTAYPTLSGVGSSTVSETGVSGTVGSYIFASNNSPTTVTATLVSGGLQGAMFAVRYAWVSVNKAINGTRLSANDQFKYAITATANGTQLASNTSSGTGGGPFTAAQVTVAAGYPVTLTESMAAGSVSSISAYTSTLTCTNANSGSSTAMPTNAAGPNVNLGTLAFGDGVTCVFTNTAKRPSLTVSKSSTVLSDPVNGSDNPKRIPGSVVSYTITVTNTGTGTVDASSLIITDAIPANTSLYVSSSGGNPIEFIDGSPASGLSFNYASNVSFSNAAGGGSPYTYTPVADAAGFDASVTGIRVAPSGTMNAAGSGNPSFSIRFRVKVK